MNVNNIFISGYCLDIDDQSSSDDYEESLNKLEYFLASVPDYNNVKTCKDWLQYDLGGETLRDIIYEIADFNDQVFAEKIKDLNHITKGNRGQVYSVVAFGSSGLGAVYNGEFIGFYSQDKVIPTVQGQIQISTSEELFEMNYKNLGNYPIDEKSFSERGQLIFDKISYHEDFHTTLSTVKSGDFKMYSIEFVRALRALHNSFPNLTSNGHNPPDLIKIKEETGKAGRTMGCTPQGDSKSGLFYGFKLVGIDGTVHDKPKLNCEYHLKLNFDNQGNKIPKGAKMNNRAYFGLPLIEGVKYIALAHLGGHYNKDK